MKKSISLSTYRFLDLAIFTFLMIVFEIIAIKGINWFSEVYCISLFLSISLIVLMRWGLWAIIPIISGALIFCYEIDGNFENYLVYVIGDLFILINMLWFIKGRQKLKNTYITICYVVSGYLLVQIGRSIVSAILGYPFFTTLVGFLGTDSLNCLLALIIIFIAKKQNGLFENQIEYLKRIDKEKKKEEASLEVHNYNEN